MVGVLALLFIIVPTIEIFLLLELKDAFGWLNTIALVVFTGVLGSYLVRLQGLRVLQLIQRDLQEGRMPGDRILSGVLILIGGLLLLTPGVMTDIVGFMLMVPGNRRFLVQRGRILLEQNMQNGGTAGKGMFFHFGSSNPDKDIEA